MVNKIIGLLNEKTICLNLEAQDSSDVITTLGKLLYDSGVVKHSFISAALKREAELPTGLPLSGSHNAAIPHTEIEHVHQAGLAMATLISPVTFQNMISPSDPVEVRLVFLLALDQPKAQVEALQEIAGVLQSEEIVNALINAKDFGDIQKALTL
ncbi:MAG: PTS sugar transporter subunit IIA [Anaerolineaceae bacterium]|nr:PTS sugar transporter subunit IIA [Anaerolineaceae bacterium]